MSFRVLIHRDGYLIFDVSSPIDYDLLNSERPEAGTNLKKLLGQKVELDRTSSGRVKQEAVLSSFLGISLMMLVLLGTFGLASVCFFCVSGWGEEDQRKALHLVQDKILECGFRPSDFTILDVKEVLDLSCGREYDEKWEVILSLQSSVDVVKRAEVEALKRKEREAQNQATRQFAYMGQCDAHGMVGTGNMAHDAGMNHWNKAAALRSQREALEGEIRAGARPSIVPRGDQTEDKVQPEDLRSGISHVNGTEVLYA